jgi:hypothetical protein
MSFLNRLKHTFITIYPPDGFEPSFALIDEYIDKPFFNGFTLFAAFIGLPSRQHYCAKFWEQAGNQAATPLSLLQNFLDIEPHEPRSFWFNLLKAPLFILLHILIILFRLPLNLIKLVSEFLPACLLDLYDSYAPQYFFIKLFFPLMCGLVLPFYLWGRSLTSPFKSLLFFIKKSSDPDIGSLASFSYLLLAALSLSSTILTYTLLFPLTMQTLSAVLLPSLTHMLPPIFSVLGAALLNLIPLPLLLEPAWAGLGCAAAIISTFVLGPIQHFIVEDIFARWYFANKDQGYKPKKENLTEYLEKHSKYFSLIRVKKGELILEEEYYNEEERSKRIKAFAAENPPATSTPIPQRQLA